MEIEIKSSRILNAFTEGMMNVDYREDLFWGATDCLLKKEKKKERKSWMMKD